MANVVIEKITGYFRSRPEFILDRQSFLNDNAKLLWWLTLGLAIAVFARSWQHYLNPALYVEDAPYYFKLGYNADFEWSNLFRNPNGYYNIFNNFISSVIGKIDVRLQPLVYQSVATTISILTILLYCRLGLIRNRILLVTMPFFFGLSGLNHINYYLTITFLMYVLVLTFFTVLLLEKQSSRIKNVFIFLSIPVLVFSGPYSVLAAPFALMFIFLFRGKTWIMLWTIVVTIVYALTTTGSTIMLENIFVEKFQVLWFNALIKDIFLLGLRNSVNIEKVLLLIAIFGPLIYIIRRHTFHLRILLLLLALIVSNMAPLFLSKKYILYGSVYPCHLLLGKFFWILSLLIIFDRLLVTVRRNWEKPLALILSSLILAFIVIDNIKHPDMRFTEILTNVPKFLNTVHELESLPLSNTKEIYRVVAEGSGIFTPVAFVGSRAPDAKITRIYFIFKNGEVRGGPTK